jgi:predicted PurR-regulated permease PerM
MPQKNTSNDYTFLQKVWITGSIFALIVVILLLLKATFSVFLLILAGTLIAVFFTGLSSLIERKTKWNPSLSLAISVIGTLLIIVGLLWLIGAKVQSQITQLSDSFPSTVQNATEQLSKTPVGQKIIKRASSPEVQQKAKTVASTFFKSTFGILGDIYVVLFLGIFFTVSPQVYKRGMVELVPKQERQKANDLPNKVGESLRKWLKGKLFAMLIVFVLTAIGLAIIGVPMWLTLALIAGVLNFIPNFGPLIAMIPAVLVAFMQGPATAAVVAGLYIIVQVVESNFITPQIQRKLVSIPPALIIIAQLLMGVLTGGWGLLLATPLMLIVIVLVQETYIKRLNKE